MKIETNADGTIKELPAGLQRKNVAMIMAQPAINPIMAIAAIQYQYNTWQAAKDGRYQWPEKFRVFNFLTGTSCFDIMYKLGRYGISCQVLLLQFELWPDKRGIGLSFSFWVPKTQAAMADDILRQFAPGCGVFVEHAQIGTGATYGEPWGVHAKARSWDAALNMFVFKLIGGEMKKQPKLENEKGKAYKAIPGKTARGPAELSQRSEERRVGKEC